MVKANMASLIPEKLVVLEMANNHMGDVEHGLLVIREFAKVCHDFPSFSFAFKLQYRDLDTFIHPNFKDRLDIKYIKRFSETRLSPAHKRLLIAEMKKNNFTAMCTPFDDISVGHIVEDKFDILKVGSASFTDWPMLEHAVRTGLPMILSTGGATLEEIDNVVSFLQHRDTDFALMHCVAEYPTRAEHMELNQIDWLKQRFPGVQIGYSTHENPALTMPVAMVIAKGCTILEKHVGVAAGDYALNEYSASPAQVREWLKAAQSAFSMLGVTARRLDTTKEEQSTLLSLRRGLFAKRDISAGTVLRDEDVFMAIPTQSEHVVANEWSKYNRFTTLTDIKALEPVLHSSVRKDDMRDKIISIVLSVNEMLELGNIVIPKNVKLEISHHYGVDRFHEVGAALITVINRDYCKKVIVMVPGQKHPTHHHNKKDETLHVLHGTLCVTLDGVTKDYTKGEMIVVEPGMRHSFETKTGSVFEEISSTHFANDSCYADESIGGYSDRKTLITYWSGLTPRVNQETNATKAFASTKG